MLFRLDDGNVTTVPVVVNVAVDVAEDTRAYFGGSSFDSGPYNQVVQYGTRSSGEDGSGDYRYYFLDLKMRADVTLHLEWDSPESSNEIYVLTKETDWYSENHPSRYGPGTEETRTYRTYSANGTFHFTTSLHKGLSIVVSRSTYLAGIAAVEHPRGYADIRLQNTAPYASFSVSPSSGGLSTVFTVDASTSWDSEDPTSALRVRWDWKDDGEWDTAWSVEKTAQHQYGETGTFWILLEVNDTGGLIGTDIDWVWVTNVLPDASFEYSPEEPRVGEEVTFDASGSSDTDGTIAWYEWDFNDGHTLGVDYPVVAHAFDEEGTYFVQLEAFDDGGLMDIATELVWVTPADTIPPHISHTSPGDVSVGERVVIRAEVKDVGGVDEVILHWMGVEGEDFNNVLMSNVYVDTYELEIPAQQEAGVLQYHISATDEAGNEARNPSTGEHTCRVLAGVEPFAFSPPLIAAVGAAVLVLVVVVSIGLYLRRRKGRG